MRLGISGIAVNNLTGLGRLNRAVILALAQEASDWELHVFLRDESDMRMLQEESPRQSSRLLDNLHLHFAEGPGRKRPLMEEFELPARFERLKLDAYLGCDFTLPGRKVARKEFVFIADMLPFTRSRTVNPASGWWYRRGVRRAVARGAHTICISEATQREFRRIFPNSRGGLSVVYPALPPRMLELAEQQPSSDYGLQVQGSRHLLSNPGPFLLAVGVLGRRKNAALMVEVFRDAVLEGGYRGSLVLAGGDGRFHTPSAEPQMAYVTVGAGQPQEAERRPEVYDIGRVNDYDLSQLYRQADLLLCLSSEEGFGYPVLEALAHGTPALVTEGSSMAEISEHGIVQTPLDTEQAVQRLASASASLVMLRREAKETPIEHYSVERLGLELKQIISPGGD